MGSRVHRIGVAATAVAAAIALTGGPTASGGSVAQWCGDGSPTAVDRPDVVTGRQIHVIYAYPSDWTPRASTYTSAIVDDLTELDSWWRSKDFTRTPRFDLASFPGCSGLPSLDISIVKLPFAWEHYAGDAGRFNQVRTDLVTAGFGNGFKKYVVYFDGPVSRPSGNLTLCGQGTVNPSAGGVSGYSMLYAVCRESYPESGPLVVGHELLHSLGALSPGGGAHSCPGDVLHVCDSSQDLLYPRFGAGERLSQKALDSGRDDYYGHSGSGWDVQDSPWLRRLDVAQHQLTVTVSGRGAVVVGDLPGFPECSSTCTSTWEAGTQLSLGSRSESGAVWRGWGGACSGTDTCTLTMDGPKTVTARVAFPVQVTVTTTGSGSVASSPAKLTCPSACSGTFDSDTTVTLTATPAAGSRFAGWSGACSGAAASCTLTLEAAKTVGAAFETVRSELRVSVSGGGKVVSSPAGISCPAACSATFEGDRRLQLTPRAAKGWRFRGWNGDCSGAGLCIVVMGEARAVQALFVKQPAPKAKPKK